MSPPKRIPIAARYLGENSFKPGRFSLGIFSFPCALISVCWMLFMGIVLLFPASPGANTEDMNYASVVLFGTLILSLVWYWLPVYGGVHWFTGPVPTVLKGKSVERDGSNTREIIEEVIVDVQKISKEEED